MLKREGERRLRPPSKMPIKKKLGERVRGKGERDPALSLLQRVLDLWKGPQGNHLKLARRRNGAAMSSIGRSPEVRVS